MRNVLFLCLQCATILCIVSPASDSDIAAYLIYNEAVHCQDNRDIKCAIDKYTAALSAKHEFPEAHQNIALLLEHSDTNAALKHHRLSVEYGVSDEFKAAALTNLAMSMFRMIPNKSKVTSLEVISTLQEANALSHQNCNILFSLGLVYSDIGDYESAVTFFQQTLEINPDHSMALLNIGNYYFRKFDFKRASVFYEWAIETAEEGNDLEKASDITVSLMTTNVLVS